MLAGVASPVRAGHLYEVYAVDTLPGGTGNFALDVNNLRQVTGNSRISTASTPLRPYVWQGPGSGPATDLGVLPGVPNFGRGYAINDSGVIVGESGNGPSKAFKYENGILSEIANTLGGTTGVAFDINNRGDIVGNASNGAAVRPFLVQAGSSQMIDLGTHLGTTNSVGRAFGISQNGLVAGVAQTSVAGSTVSHATLWEIAASGGITRTDLGALRSASNFSQAHAVNDFGQVVGSSVVGKVSPTSTTDLYRAFLWDNGVMTELPILDSQPTFIHAEAKDINAAGLAVGYVARFFNAPSFGGAAVLWQNGQAIDLNALLPAGSGWNLLSAEGINDRGDIVGFGTFGGQTRGFLLRAVPEPGSVVMLATGGALLGLAAWRRRDRRASRHPA